MILIILAYSYVFYSFWVVFTLETRGSGANISIHVLEFRSSEIMVSGGLRTK